MWASRYGHDAVVEELVSRGAVVNQHNERGQTALLVAAGCGNASCVTTLLRAGANPVADASGWTALSVAASYGHLPVLDTLLSYGPQQLWTRKDFKSALQAAVANQHEECAELLHNCLFSLGPDQAAVAHAGAAGEVPNVLAEAQGLRLHLSSDNKTGYLNVREDRRTTPGARPFTAAYREDGRTVSLGTFLTAVDAAVAYARRAGEVPGEETGAKERAEARAARREEPAAKHSEKGKATEAEGVRLRLSNISETGYRGVVRAPQGRFSAAIQEGAAKRKRSLGIFDTAEEAAAAYTRAVARAMGAITEAEGLLLHLSIKSNTGYLGVTKLASGRVQAKHWVDGKEACLGCFDTAVEAAVAYARAVGVARASRAADEVAASEQDDTPRPKRLRPVSSTNRGRCRLAGSLGADYVSGQKDETKLLHPPYAGSIRDEPAKDETLASSTPVQVYYIGHGWCRGTLLSPATVGGKADVNFEKDGFQQVWLDWATYGRHRVWVLPVGAEQDGVNEEWLRQVRPPSLTLAFRRGATHPIV